MLLADSVICSGCFGCGCFGVAIAFINRDSNLVTRTVKKA